MVPSIVTVTSPGTLVVIVTTLPAVDVYIYGASVSGVVCAGFVAAGFVAAGFVAAGFVAAGFVAAGFVAGAGAGAGVAGFVAGAGAGAGVTGFVVCSGAAGFVCVFSVVTSSSVCLSSSVSDTTSLVSFSVLSSVVFMTDCSSDCSVTNSDVPASASLFPPVFLSDRPDNPAARAIVPGIL